MVSVGDRSLFPGLEARAYLGHCAISPWSTPVVEALERAAADWARRGVDAFLAQKADRDALRLELARLVGADSDEIALVPNVTSAAIGVANCFDWRPGDRLLLFRGEFPTNVTPWQAAARHFDLEVVWLDTSLFLDSPEAGLAAFEAALKKHLRLAAVSLVEFQTGLRMPVEEMARLAHQYGCRLFVDGIQAAGAMPIDCQGWGLDFLAVGSHKWLMGPDGAGFLRVARQAWGELVPRLAGWLSHTDALDFLFLGEGHLRYDRPLRQDPAFFESGSLNSLGYAGLRASVGLLLELGTGSIFEHIQAYLDPLEEGLIELGFSSLRRRHGRSGILALRPPTGLVAGELVAGLKTHGVIASHPDGLLRLGPHWPNGLAEVEAVLAAVRSCL
ncbi:MAG: aminotransferase class V-fold PLP-dependent enzyme [Candidatus Eremiobacteraeota bacterium]|nr:aminotransferase class V-fold PLP-dependent enzyme [Candidatus Eremiobacteraeota bacterium]